MDRHGTGLIRAAHTIVWHGMARHSHAIQSHQRVMHVCSSGAQVLRVLRCWLAMLLLLLLMMMFSLKEI